MAADSRRLRADDAAVTEPQVVQLRTCPGKCVFTERGNRDGWIATDAVVDLER